MLASKLLKQLKHKSDCLVQLTLKAQICHKSELSQSNCYRWPYETRSYKWYNFFLDPRTSKKFGENTKIIQVDGNIASGKHDFAKRLADELGMKYYPPVDLDAIYVNSNGYDYRALNPLLPERLRNCDWEMFHENPSRHSVIHMQDYLFRLRLLQYLYATQHIFNTGQGVVLVRTPFTERAIVEAMNKVGWLPRGYERSDGVQFYDWIQRYISVRNETLEYFLKPHLTIYLRTPVETCLDRIKNSDNPMIRNSRAHQPEFLEAIEDAFTRIVLPKQEYNGHVMEIDYPERATDGQIMDIIDDIKELDFTIDPQDTRFYDWDPEGSSSWYYEKRSFLTSSQSLAAFECIEPEWWDIAGLGDSITQIDLKLRSYLYESHVWDHGYADKNQVLIYKRMFEFNLGKSLYRAVINDFP